MAEQGVAYKEIDVSKDRQAAQDLVRLSGQMAVPVITVDEQVVVGFDQEKLDQLIKH